MKKEGMIKAVEGVVLVTLGALLYVRITNYYALTKKWVDTFDNHLKFYITSLWLLVAVLIVIVIVFLIELDQDPSWKSIILGSAVIMTSILVIVQFVRQPNYQSYYVTPFPVSAKSVEKQINKKHYSLYSFPIYFYDSKDPSYKKVKSTIRSYSLQENNDFSCIDTQKLKTKLGNRRYEKLIQKAKVTSHNAVIFTYPDEDSGRNHLVTFNHLQKHHVLNRALQFAEDH